MTVEELQHALGVTVDGKFGPASKAALFAKFTNASAPAITPAELQGIADQLGCTVKQIAAVASVESSGGGFDKQGRPKILFERHLFHRMTGGKWSPAAFSQSSGGGYSESSWDKLASACGRDPDAAFSAVSWGKFQVLGLHWSKLGYASSFELALSTVQSEAAHYELLARYCRTFGLVDDIRRISTSPNDCIGFAQGYNGPAFRRFDYHTKIARAMT